MINLDRHKFEFQCPECEFYNCATMKQARLRDFIICRGCKINLRLDDSMNSCRKAVRQFRKSMREFEREIENLNKALQF